MVILLEWYLVSATLSFHNFLGQANFSHYYEVLITVLTELELTAAVKKKKIDFQRVHVEIQ